MGVQFATQALSSPVELQNEVLKHSLLHLAGFNFFVDQVSDQIARSRSYIVLGDLFLLPNLFVSLIEIFLLLKVVIGVLDAPLSLHLEHYELLKVLTR